MLRFYLILVSVLLLGGGTGSAQVNHVLNGDFEDSVFCPKEWEQIYAARHWHSLDTMEVFFNPGHPEYCHKCANGSSLFTGVPENGAFYQYPHSGAGMAQVQMFYDESYEPMLPYSRDYLQGRLRKTLTAGKSYCVSFYVNLEEMSAYAIREIGAYLDNGIIDTTKNYGLPQTMYTPQVVNSGGIITDTLRWTKIEGAFVAKGTEQFITIGNFRSKAGTTYAAVPINDYNNGSNYTWYLVDDVSVIESDLPADAGSNRHIGLGDSTYIGRPKEVGLECTWTVLGSSAVIGTGAGLWVKPAVTTQYVVTQTLCGATKKDTVWVGVYGVGVPNVYGKAQQYSLSPNPSNGFIQLTQAVQDERPLRVQVVEATGRLVHAQVAVFNGGKLELDLSAVAPGCYFIQLKDKDGNASSLRMLKR